MMEEWVVLKVLGKRQRQSTRGVQYSYSLETLNNLSRSITVTWSILFVGMGLDPKMIVGTPSMNLLT